MIAYRSLFGFGVSIYAVVHLAWTGFLTYNFVDGSAPHIVALVILSVVVAIAGSSLHFASWKDILPYSLTWAVCMAILNTVMSAPFVGWGVFTEPYVWFSYVLVIIVPLFFAEGHVSAHQMSRWHA